MSESKRRDDEEWVVEGERCLVSDPALPHYLSRRTSVDTKHDCFSCGKRSPTWGFYEFHYYCTICQAEFHGNCYEYPSKMIHPYHPQHPLTFTYLEKDTIFDTDGHEHFIFCNNGNIFPRTSEKISGCSVIFDKCTWCDNDLGEWFYRCQICNFILDIDCAQQRPPLTIQNPKSHHHSLSLFPRPLLFPCNACGLTNVVEPGYACYQCNYVVHQDCIELPRVIKITRHPHRLSYTPYHLIRVSSCRVCYKYVDIKYGQYFCNLGDCSYVAHSKCATHYSVWGGKELEWEPEEPEEAIAPPYKKVGDGLIQHFCHEHHYLKLEKYNSARKQCQACMRSITSHDDFYNCIECDYFLHELCANLPRKMDHLLHIHSLFLDTSPLESHDYKELRCNVCWRATSGWKYVCTKDGCGDSFKVDVNCILVKECFTHESHPEHPLFISTVNYNFIYIECQKCKTWIYSRKSRLNCTICKFVLCFICATIPTKFYYKYDERRLLSLCYGESGIDDKYWCELCESSLDPTEWFYTNKQLCITIHLTCLFGDAAYMKAGHTFDYYSAKKMEVVGNSSSTRPICYQCHQRCAQPVYLKAYKQDKTLVVFCSFYCMRCPW